MDYRALCISEEEKFKNKWKDDPMLVFVNFIEERKLKLFDMFKYFDKDKSCSLSRDEFLDGLKVITFDDFRLFIKREVFSKVSFLFFFFFFSK